MITVDRLQAQRLVDRAQARGGVKLVEPLAEAYFVAGSGPGRFYVVRPVAGELRCQCPAAAHEQACYHLAAVWLYQRLREAEAVPQTPLTPRPSDGGTPPGPGGLRHRLEPDLGPLTPQRAAAAGR